MFREKLMKLAKASREDFNKINDRVTVETDADLSQLVVEERIVQVWQNLDTRIILTHSKAFEGQKLPLYLNMHGGGFIQGTADYDQKFVEITAATIPCLVINVDYKPSPEYPFPTALEESYGVLKWALSHAGELRIDPSKVAVGGHSAGAGLAVSISLLNRVRQDFAISGLLLDYPPVDMRYPALLEDLPDEVSGSSVNGAFFNTCYLEKDVNRFNLYASPLMVEDAAGLPRTLMITGELDGLTGPARKYADKLEAAGVPLEYYCMPDCRHGFMTLPHNGTKEAFEKGWQLRRNYLKKLFQ